MMNRYVEPKGWSDMTESSKESIVNKLAVVGLIDLDLDVSSNNLLDAVRQSPKGGLDFYHAKSVIESRGIDEVAGQIETRAQGSALVSLFGDKVVEMLPVLKGQDNDQGLGR